MPDQLLPLEKAFIRSDLRPDVGPIDEDSPPLAANAPPQELQRQAAELLGPELRSQLGVGDPDGKPLESAQICTKKADVVWSAVDGEAVLLDLDSGYYFSLNQVGTVIWELFDGQRTLGEIHDVVCERFDVDSATAWDDLAALVRRLWGEKLATITSGAAIGR